MSKARLLVQACVRLLKTYDSALTSVEAHFEAFKSEDPVHRRCLWTLISQEKNAPIEQQAWDIFEGCVNYNKVLRVSIDIFPLLIVCRSSLTASILRLVLLT